MKKDKLKVYLLLTIVIIMSSCDLMDGPKKMKALPKSLLISNLESTKTLLLSNRSKGNTDFQIANHPQWLDISPMQGQIAGNEVQLDIQFTRNDMNPGVYHGKIDIISNNAGLFKVDVTLEVDRNPKIHFVDSLIRFPTNISENTLTIGNQGNRNLLWEIEKSPEWIQFSMFSGLISPGDQKSIIVSCSREALDIGHYAEYITVKTNSHLSQDSVPVTLEVPRIFDLSISPDSLFFDYYAEDQEVYIKNNGNTPVNWSVKRLDNYKLSSYNGSIPKFDSVKLIIELERTGLIHGTSHTNITFEYAGQLEKSLPIGINNFVETKLHLLGNMVDAEYCKQTDKMIFVASNPNRLSIYNPGNQEISTIALKSPPTCVSVIYDGSLAVVGHNQLLSYIDLNSMVIESELWVPTKPFDVAIANNKWTYFVQNTGEWTSVIHFNYGDKEDNQFYYSTTNSSYAKSLIKILPNSKYMYSCRKTGSSIKKFDIRNMIAKSVQTYSTKPCKNFWFDTMGTKVFADSYVYSLTSNNAKDLSYYSKLDPIESIFWLDHSEINNRVYVITVDNRSSNYGSYVATYDDTYFEFIESYEIEPYILPQGETGASILTPSAEYAFCNSLGTHLTVITQASTGIGFAKIWGIQQINLD